MLVNGRVRAESQYLQAQSVGGSTPPHHCFSPQAFRMISEACRQVTTVEHCLNCLDKQETLKENYTTIMDVLLPRMLFLMAGEFGRI